MTNDLNRQIVFIREQIKNCNSSGFNENAQIYTDILESLLIIENEQSSFKDKHCVTMSQEAYQNLENYRTREGIRSHHETMALKYKKEFNYRAGTVGEIYCAMCKAVGCVNESYECQKHQLPFTVNPFYTCDLAIIKIKKNNGNK